MKAVFCFVSSWQNIVQSWRVPGDDRLVAGHGVEEQAVVDNSVPGRGAE